MNLRRMPAHVLQRKPQNRRRHNRVRAAVNRHHLMPRRIKLPQMRNQPRKPPRQRHRLAVQARLNRPNLPQNRRHIALQRPPAQQHICGFVHLDAVDHRVEPQVRQQRIQRRDARQNGHAEIQRRRKLQHQKRRQRRHQRMAVECKRHRRMIQRRLNNARRHVVISRNARRIAGVAFVKQRRDARAQRLQKRARGDAGVHVQDLRRPAAGVLHFARDLRHGLQAQAGNVDVRRARRGRWQGIWWRGVAHDVPSGWSTRRSSMSLP